MYEYVFALTSLRAVKAEEYANDAGGCSVNILSEFIEHGSAATSGSIVTLYGSTIGLIRHP